jgi:hypothetical protein
MEEMLWANQDKMEAWLIEKQDGRKETTACHEATKADTEMTEPDPGKMQSVGEHHEVPKEEAVVMQVGGLTKRRRDRSLAARSRRKGSMQVVNRGRNWPSPAGRCPAAQEWHGTREAASERTAPGSRLSEQPEE